MTPRKHHVWSLLPILVLSAVSLPAVGARPDTGSVSGRVHLLGADGSELDASKVVVSLQDVPDSDPRRLHVQHNAKIVQRDRRFSPELTVITTGSTVEFPNEDFIDHNVFSLSQARVFDLGLYRNPDSKTVTFLRSGVVDVYCNIHPEMAAKIKVMDTIYYSQPAPGGAFALTGVPSGSYPVVVWQPYGDEYSGQVTVAAGQVTQIEITLHESARVRQHANKEGKPYGRYH
jgi:plastocyanin